MRVLSETQLLSVKGVNGKKTSSGLKGLSKMWSKEQVLILFLSLTFTLLPIACWPQGALPSCSPSGSN